MTSPEQIAAGLSEAQRKMLITRRLGKTITTLRALQRRGILAKKAPVGWSLTPLGLQVRTALQKEAPKDEG